MTELRRTSFDTPGSVIQQGTGRVDVIDLGGRPMWRLSYPAGWRWSEQAGATAGQRWCRLRHVGAVISGRFHVDHEDGTTMELGPGDAYEIGPGHDGRVLGDEPWVAVDFGPALERDLGEP